MFWGSRGLEYLLTFMTYHAHLIFCTDDMESVLEAKNGACLPYIASVLAERLVQLIKQTALFKTILNLQRALQLAHHLQGLASGTMLPWQTRWDETGKQAEERAL